MSDATTATGHLADIRASEFVAVSELAYFDHASDSPIPARTAAVIAERTSLLQNPAAAVKVREDYLREAQQRLGRMLNADPDQFAFLTNISDATATIANGLNWQPGDEVVLVRGEFASFVYPWRNLEPHGVVVRFVEKNVPPGNDLDHIAAAVNQRTKVVAISHVEFESGYRNDLAAIAAPAHAVGALFVVDASQSLGVLELDVQRDGIDALVSIGYKWLMAPHGIAALYIDESIMDRIRPTMPGRYSTVDGWKTLDYDLDWLPGASRYQGGALNWIGVCALAESLGLLEEIGSHTVESAAMHISNQLLERLADLPVEITSVVDPSHRSSMLSFTLGSPEADERCVVTGREQGILFGRRGYGIRVGAHCWNSISDIDRLIAHIRGCL